MKRILAIGAFWLCAASSQATTLPNMTPAALRQLSVQANHGDSEAMVEIGDAYQYGRTTVKGDNRSAAVAWYQHAVALGNIKAERELGYLYDDGDRWPGIKADDARAFAWFSRAAESGDAIAQGRLAGEFEGPSPRRNYRQAYHWRLKAAHQGDPVSAEKLDGVYVAGCNVANFPEAIARIEMAAKAGDADAQWRLGVIEADDDFGRRDNTGSVDWLQKSATQHNVKGLYYLAVRIYSDGESLDRDAKVLPLLAESADKGFVPAQLWWARFYQTPPGLSTTNDTVERRIFEWFHAAAEQGYDLAQQSLSHYYDAGIFVPVDRAEAYKWYLLSWHSPIHDGFHVESVLDATAAEQVEGKARANTWLVTHPQPYPLPATASDSCTAK